MLYVSSTVVVVGAKDRGILSTKRVTFWDTNDDTVKAEVSFMNPIRTIGLNQKRMVVGLDHKIYVYDYDMNEITNIRLFSNTIKYTMSPSIENPYLLISSGEFGEAISIYDINDGKLVNSFKAHEAPVYKMCFNEKGNMLASSSTNVYIIFI